MGEIETAEKIIIEKAEEVLDDIADTIFTVSQETIVAKGAVDEGTLLKSGSIQKAPLERTVVYSASYARYVEFGTDPHMPPVEPLIGWVRRKLGVGEKKARGVAFAIAKTIAKEGSEPKSFLQEGVNAARQKFGRGF